MKMSIGSVKKIAMKAGMGFAVGSAVAVVAEKIGPIAPYANFVGLITAFSAGNIVGAGAYALGSDMLGSLGM